MPWKRIATEGATIDDREIPRDWIVEMAESYDPKVYGARISLEHIKGVTPDSPFKAYGDVLALRAQENADGKMELFGDLDPTDELRAMNKARQKIYTSIEVYPNFAKTGKAYLSGLAVTDTPSSLGTEMLSFCAQQGDKSPLASRKSSKTAMFSAAVDAGDIEKADAEFSSSAPTDDKSSLRDRIKAMFSRTEKSAERGDDALRNEVAEGMQLFADRHQALEERVDGLPTADQFTAMQAKIDEMYAALDATPDTPPRTPATGSTGGEAVTDC